MPSDFGCHVVRPPNTRTLSLYRIVGDVMSVRVTPESGFITVRREEGMNSNKVRPSRVSEPTHTTNQTLIGFFTLDIK